MPSTLDVPRREVDHGPSRFEPRRLGREAVCLVDRSGGPAFYTFHGTVEYVGSCPRHRKVEIPGRPAARDVDALLCEDRPRIGTPVGHVDRHAAGAIAVIVSPKQWIRTPMSRKVGGVEVDHSVTGHREDLGREEPGEGHDTDQVGTPQECQLVGEAAAFAPSRSDRRNRGSSTPVIHHVAVPEAHPSGGNASNSLPEWSGIVRLDDRQNFVVASQTFESPQAERAAGREEYDLQCEGRWAAIARSRRLRGRRIERGRLTPPGGSGS